MCMRIWSTVSMYCIVLYTLCSHATYITYNYVCTVCSQWCLCIKLIGPVCYSGRTWKQCTCGQCLVWHIDKKHSRHRLSFSSGPPLLLYCTCSVTRQTTFCSDSQWWTAHRQGLSLAMLDHHTAQTAMEPTYCSYVVRTYATGSVNFAMKEKLYIPHVASRAVYTVYECQVVLTLLSCTGWRPHSYLHKVPTIDS